MKPELEMEIKALEIDKGSLERTLQRVNAKKNYDTTMMITSYDFFETPSSSAAPKGIQNVIAAAYEFYTEHGSLRENNAHLRLRTFTHTDKIEFTFKHDIPGGSKRDLKVAHEYNAHLSKSELTYLTDNLQLLGIEENALHEKRRSSWLLPNECICDIDTYPHIPTYIELEGSEKQINDTVALLGLTDHLTTQDSGAHFFASYNQEFYSKLVF